MNQEELDRCSEDPVYFINKYCDIASCGNQEDLIRNLLGSGGRPLVVAVSRQPHTMSVFALYSIWYALFNDGKRVYIADSCDSSMVFMVRAMCNRVSKSIDFEEPCEGDGVGCIGHIKLVNGSTITVDGNISDVCGVVS